MYCENADPTLIGCTIAYNAAAYVGGGIYGKNYSDVTLENCQIIGNAADNGGGFRIFWDCTLTATNCVIARNASFYTNGGVSYLNGASVTLNNCTLTHNRSYGRGAAFRCSDSDLTLRNCILWGNESSVEDYEITLDNTTLTVSYSDFEGGQDAISGYGHTVNWGDGNIDIDPLLTRFGTHLRANSPCIDAADPDADYTGQTDLDAEDRIHDGRADIGADEFIDTDIDELPNWWEQRFFDSPTAGDPVGDGDGDLLVNVNEYAQSRNPLNPPLTYYVDVAGDNDWDGLAAAWDGTHGPKATIQSAIDATGRYEADVASTANVATGLRTGRSVGYPCPTWRPISRRPNVAPGSVPDAVRRRGGGPTFPTSTACIAIRRQCSNHATSVRVPNEPLPARNAAGIRRISAQTPAPPVYNAN